MTMMSPPLPPAENRLAVRDGGVADEDVVLEEGLGADVDAAEREASAKGRAETGEEFGQARRGWHVQRLAAVRASPQHGAHADASMAHAARAAVGVGGAHAAAAAGAVVPRLLPRGHVHPLDVPGAVVAELKGGQRQLP